MNGSGIGIRVADGSYFPVLEAGFTGQKRLVLTTVEDEQTRLQIDFYQGEEGGEAPGEYIGSLVLEDIETAARGEPEIELRLSVDEAGGFRAKATDLGRGESQSLSVNLSALSGEETYGVPESAFDDDDDAELELDEGEHEAYLTGESYPVGVTDSRKRHLHRKRSPLFIAGLVVVGLILIFLIAFVVYTLFKGPQVPPLLANVFNRGGVFFSPEDPTDQDSDVETLETEREEPAAAAEAAADDGAARTQNRELAETEADGIWYKVKEGDTLWDISAIYYRNPWLYYRIAAANKIQDPNNIYAGTRLFIPDN